MKKLYQATMTEIIQRELQVVVAIVNSHPLSRYISFKSTYTATDVVMRPSEVVANVKDLFCLATS